MEKIKLAVSIPLCSNPLEQGKNTIMDFLEFNENRINSVSFISDCNIPIEKNEVILPKEQKFFFQMNNNLFSGS